MNRVGKNRAERRLAAILAADVAGYSRLIGEDEDGTLDRLRSIRAEVIDPKIAEHRGRLVKTTGDGFLVEFASVVDALRCASEWQQAMAGRSAGMAVAERIEFRIGINVGDVVVEDGDIFGDGVNVAARLEALADPGGICVSARVQEDAAGRLDLAFDDLGDRQLKNIARPVRVYRVRATLTHPAANAPGATLSRTAGEGAERQRREAGEGNSPPALALPDKPSIAVLPFQNMSGDPEQEYFADGMVEEIITALSRIRWLFVIARNSSFTYKGRAVDVKQVGCELGVRYVLEGSVRKAGERVRITGQLIDAVTGTHLWADRFDGLIEDVFELQDQVATSVAGVIEPALAEAEQQRAVRKLPERLDAWEAYQRGLWHFYKYALEENTTAVGFFRQAIALDPNFAPGHYGYALALQWNTWHFSTRPYSEVQGTAREEARIAVSLDDKDAMAHAVLAHMMMWGSEWEASIAEARKALALNPNSAFVISMLGCVLGFGGYREEALDRLQQAMRASPHDPLTWLWSTWTAAMQFFSRDFEAALTTMRAVLRLRPGYVLGYLTTAAALAHLGRLDEAREVVDRARALFPDLLPRDQQRPPWVRPEDHALRIEGLRLAMGEMG
jgi:adenylate cyclase